MGQSSATARPARISPRGRKAPRSQDRVQPHLQQSQAARPELGPTEQTARDSVGLVGGHGMPDRYPIYPYGTLHGPGKDERGRWIKPVLPKPIGWIHAGGNIERA